MLETSLAFYSFTTSLPKASVLLALLLTHKWNLGKVASKEDMLY